MTQAGKFLVIAGVLVIILGLIIWLWGDKFGWIGRLPGDIRIERGSTRVYIPIVTMLLFSLIFSAILWLVNRLF